MIIELQEWETVEGLELAPATVHALVLSQAFTVSPDRAATGRWCVTAQRYVGVTTIGDVQFRVAPKLPVHRLIELLCETMDLVDWLPEDADWAESEDLLATIAASFIGHTERALRLGLIQGYLTVEDDLYSVRGRIDFGRQAGRPRELPLPIAVTFDEYTTNIRENQLLAGAGRVLRRFRSLPTELLTRLRRLEHRLLDVVPTPPSLDPPAVAWSRLNERYRWAVSLSRLILRSAALDFDGPRGGLGTSFLVNMDRLFESIVGRGVQRTLATGGVSVQLQATDRLDIDGHMTFRPDIVASRNGEPIAVADLKYKSDVSNSDVYQVLAYARRYGLASALLILPQRPRFRSLDVSGTSVHLHQFDLNTGSTDREAALRRVAGDLVGRRGAFANPCPTPTRSMNPWRGA